MENKICNSLAEAAQFRAERGDLARAEDLLRRAIRIAQHGGGTNDKFFSWINLAHFLEDNERDAEAETAFKAAIESVPLIDFNMRHAIALKELGELIMRNGRPEEGLALQMLAFKVFDVLADEAAQKSVETLIHRAS